MTVGHKILVVDDDQEDHLIMTEYFKDAGKHELLRFFVNGRHALDYLDSVEDKLALPRLIVLDLNMPILNGTETLFQLKRNIRFKHIPVIIFSTSENDTEKRKCLSLGADDYLVKPTTYDGGLRMMERFTSYA